MQWGFGETNATVDICAHEDVATMTSPRVACQAGDVAPEVVDMTNVDCKTDGCFADVAMKAGATHTLRVTGFFHDTYSMQPTLSATAVITRLSDGVAHVVRPQDVDPGYDASRPRPAHHAMGVLRWFARSAAAREVEIAPAAPAVPAVKARVEESRPMANPGRGSFVLPSLLGGAAVVTLASGVYFWAGAGERDCRVSVCVTDRQSNKLGVPLVIAGGLLGLASGYLFLSQLYVSPSSNSIALVGRF